MTKIFYEEDGEKTLVCEIVGHVALIQDALRIGNVDMDEFVNGEGWDGYDPNCLVAEYTN